MIKIKVQNCNSWLLTDDHKVKKTLWKALRFRDRNYFHSRLYKQKIWDGYKDFFKKETGQFLTGLLPEVRAALAHLGLKYEIIDERTTYDFLHDQIDENFLEKFTLFDYQWDLTNQLLKYHRGIIFAPTSAGKTLIMLSILKCLQPKTPTLILTNTTTLIDQIYDDLNEWKFKNVGRLYDKKNEPNIITCANVQSLHKMEKLLPKIKALIVDEIHLMMSPRPIKYYKKMKEASVRVGVSATPFKFDEKDKVQKYNTKGYFGPVLKTQFGEKGILTTKVLQKRNILSKSDVTIYPIDKPMILHDIYMDAVTRGMAESIYFHNVVKGLVATLSGRTLILVERLNHGDTLAEMIPGALWVQGKDDTDTRKYVIDKLKNAKDKTVAIATNKIFDAGINLFVHNLINAAGGKAEHLIIQRMGRGLRPANDKEMLKYYDFMFLINDYLQAHSNKRIKILEKQGHNITIKDKIDFPI